MNDRSSFFAALFFLRLYPPVLLYLQELPEGPSGPMTFALLGLLIPACGDAALAFGSGRVQYQLALEACGLGTLLLSLPNPGLIGFCLAQVGLLVLSIRYAAVDLRW